VASARESGESSSSANAIEALFTELATPVASMIGASVKDQTNNAIITQSRRRLITSFKPSQNMQ
jgi:hypothetical protein